MIKTPPTKEEISQILEQLEGPAKEAALALLEKEKKEAELYEKTKLGIDAEMPERVKVAMRNMGPLTRKRFLDKLNKAGEFRNGRVNKGMTESQFKAYMDTFAPGIGEDDKGAVDGQV